MYVKQKMLRKVQGRSQRGDKNRQCVKLTITPETVQMVDEFVGFGNGKYGSATFELGARLLVSILTEGDLIEDLALELSEISDSPFLVSNLERLTRLVKSHVE